MPCSLRSHKVLKQVRADKAAETDNDQLQMGENFGAFYAIDFAKEIFSCFIWSY
jgi:hypothetical protein